jgi:DNA-binding beta-propeller fold protein YncE
MIFAPPVLRFTLLLSVFVGNVPIVSGLRAAAAAEPVTKITRFAGGGTGKDGSTALQAELHFPFGLDRDRNGNFFIVELEGGHVHKLNAAGILTTISGDGTRGFAGDDGPAAKGVYNAMHNLAIAPNGDVYIADTLNHRVRKIEASTGILTTFAGTGKAGFGGDQGPAREADFHGVYCIAFNPECSRLFIADLENRRIRAIHMHSGIVETVAGNGSKGVPEEGARAKAAPLVDPRAVAADAVGNVYVLERGGHALRIVDRDGAIRTVVGTGVAGFSGDGGPARAAQLRGPKHLCLARDGTVVIADTDNHAIRRYDPRSGTITRIAGIGRKGSAGVDGPADQVEMNFPHGVYVHPDGTLYVADTYNHRILRIVPE